MSQAFAELYSQWEGDDDEAILHLVKRGFRLERDWTWSRPNTDFVLSDRDNSAIRYLIDEWDFDGLRPALTEQGAAGPRRRKFRQS
jgi:hypothetical protein